jgi:hypothetical protein
MPPVWATAWKTARWCRFMQITPDYQFDEKDVLDLSVQVAL